MVYGMLRLVVIWVRVCWAGLCNCAAGPVGSRPWQPLLPPRCRRREQILLPGGRIAALHWCLQCAFGWELLGQHELLLRQWMSRKDLQQASSHLHLGMLM